MKSCDTVPLSHLEKYFSEITFLLLFQHPKFSLSQSKHVKICGQKKSIEISWFVHHSIFSDYWNIWKVYPKNIVPIESKAWFLKWPWVFIAFNRVSSIMIYFFVNAQWALLTAQLQTRFRNSLNSTSRRRSLFSSNPQITIK